MYDVGWRHSAVDDLTRIWSSSDSPTRDRLTDTIQRVEAALRHAPARAGESRDDGRRILIGPDLLAVWQPRRRLA
jgi:hypothetical protein